MKSMKNLILIFTFFTFTFINAQNAFSGMWVSDESSFITTILASEYGVTEVVNISFSEYKTIREKVLNQTSDTLRTSLVNIDNNYKVNIKYYLLNKETMVSDYSGDLKIKILLKKAI